MSSYAGETNAVYECFSRTFSTITAIRNDAFAWALSFATRISPVFLPIPLGSLLGTCTKFFHLRAKCLARVTEYTNDETQFHATVPLCSHDVVTIIIIITIFGNDCRPFACLYKLA